MSEFRLERLARKMIFLEHAAELAVRRGNTIEAQEFLEVREQIATDRSQLMRDLWARRRKTHAAV